MFKSDKREEANCLKEESLRIKEKTKALQSSLIEIQNELRELLVKIPNVPHHLVPSGKSDADNVDSSYQELLHRNRLVIYNIYNFYIISSI